MSKRKAEGKPKKVFEDESSSDDDADMLDVEFEFFDPNPDVDFQGLKTLLRQLLDIDALNFDLSALADLILAQKLLGSTVKTDGMESDPWAFLTVLNLKEHKEKPVIQELIRYLSNQGQKNAALAEIAKVLVSPEAEVGLLITERAFGVPTELIPPMYKMLAEEVQWALDENEPFKFTHYLVLSKVYVEVDSKTDREDLQARKKQKKGASGVPEVFYFHPEDEIIQRHAFAHGTYDFDNETAEKGSVPDAKRAFQETGVRPQGSLMLLHSSGYQGLVEDLEKSIGS